MICLPLSRSGMNFRTDGILGQTVSASVQAEQHLWQDTKQTSNLEHGIFLLARTSFIASPIEKAWNHMTLNQNSSLCYKRSCESGELCKNESHLFAMLREEMRARHMSLLLRLVMTWLSRKVIKR
jgi:hypothetical protein